MLPFTKRPGRDESGDEDVVTKDDISSPVSAAPASKRSVPPPGLSSSASPSPRGKFISINDDEMTNIMPTKSLGSAVSSSPRPAAGAPPPSRNGSPSSRPGPNSAPPSRNATFAARDDEEEDGRTVVRGAPKIVKRGAGSGGGAKMGMPTSPTTISPAAVIKATLESARAGVKRTGEHLMAPPPADLLEDLADRMNERHHADVGAEHTQILPSPTSKPGSFAPPPMVQGVKALSTQMISPQGMPPGSIPPGSSRPLTGPPPPLAHANQSGSYNAQQSGGYAAMFNGPVPSGSVSVPGVAMPQSMPAHFMVAQPPYSEGRTDPPGTAVTARTKVVGRPAMSWAMALAAFGLCVGVGAAAVMHATGDGFAETSASFVDPSRAASKPAAAGQGNAPPTPVPMTGDQPTNVGAPPVAVPPAAETVAIPAVTTPHAAPVAPAPATAAPAPVAAAPAAAPARAFAAPRAPQVQRPRAPAPPPQSAGDDPPAAPAPAAAATKASGKGSAAKPAAAEMDDETKKALQELQKAQLERSLQ